MTKKDFKSKHLIFVPSCMGDEWSNDMINDLLTAQCGKVQKQVLEFVSGYMDNIKDRWIHRRFGKGEVRILLSMCKAKSEGTLEKRKVMYLRILMKSHYGALLNKEKIDLFCKIFKVKI